MEWVLVGCGVVLILFAIIAVIVREVSRHPCDVIERRTRYKAPHPRRRATDFIRDSGPGDAEDSTPATEQENPPPV